MGGKPQSSRWQFSLKLTLIAFVLTAIWLVIQTSVPFGVRFLFEMFLLVSAPSVLAAMIYYGRRNVRAFAIGAFFPSLIACVMLAMISSELIMLGPYIVEDGYPLPDGGMHTARGSIVWLPTSIVVGLCTIFVRVVLVESATSNHGPKAAEQSDEPKSR